MKIDYYSMYSHYPDQVWDDSPLIPKDKQRPPRARPSKPSKPPKPIYNGPWQYPEMYNPWYVREDSIQHVQQLQPIENREVLNDIKRAINGEYSAINCYAKLARQAPNETDRNRILEIRRDEQRHLHEISRLYTSLTRKQIKPRQTEQCETNYQAGIRAAFIDEQETVDFYHEIADKARLPVVKQVFRRAAVDEQNHAVWFLYFINEK
jgi:rubrerythrin